MRILAFVVLIVVGLGCANSGRQTTSQQPTSLSSSETAINKVSVEYTHRWNWSASGDYIHIEGEIRNVTTERIEGIKIILTFYDKSQRLVTSDISYANFDPIMPGQTSPYTSMISANPAIDTYTVQFSTRSGERLNAIDRTAPPKKVKKK